jgi:predicted aspartyl protease
MKRWLPFCAALGLMLLPAAARADDDGACHLLRVTSVDMSISVASHITVPISVGGQDLTVAIDTGGISTMINQSVVDQLGLHPERLPINVRITMFGGRRIDQIVTAHDIVFGGLKAREMPFLVMPDGILTGDIQGLLAPDIMRAYDDDFDFANMKFALFDPSHCEGNLVYWTREPSSEIPFKVDEVGHIQFPVALDGQEISVALDTGASTSVIDLETAERLFNFEENDPRLTKLGRTVHGYTYKFPFKSLTFGGVTVQNPELVLVSTEDSHMRFGPTHGLIGIGILRQLHMYVSYHQHKLFVTAASAH